ncbi:hypothetical protein Glove_261g94 [Diversispora epigaea]|uniref:Uncharacterized protein n=1 Tax=Diversispora epigaea TaxID=1348612 RepID=A0A397ID25_9GLOM|nr:hypothetical protein Glove_261g94 [Diversispora epigaea]
MTRLEDPEKLESPYFKLQSTLEPNDLVKTSKIILQAVNDEPKLTQSYCLEVRFEDNKAFFTMCLNPVLWFDVYLRKKSLDVATKIARTFVTNTRLTVPYENEKVSPFEVEHCQTVNSLAFSTCIYGKSCSDRKCSKFLFADSFYLHLYGVSHRYLESLINIDNSVARDHLDIVCKDITKTRDGRENTCNFHIIGSLVIWERKKYFILFRREPIRGLLFIPRPDEGKNNFKHFDNTALIKDQLFWQDLLNERKSLGFNSISLNYGIWETGQARDKYAQNCHAHVNLNFDDVGWTNLKEMVPADTIKRKMLNDRDCPEPNNLLKNCLELERFRLQIVEPQLMVENSTKLAEKMDNVFSILYKINENLSEINAKLSETNAKLSEINAKLSQLVDLLIAKEQNSNTKND